MNVMKKIERTLWRAALAAILLFACRGLMAEDFELPPPPSAAPTINPPQVRVDWIEGIMDKSSMPEMPAMPKMPAMSKMPLVPKLPEVPYEAQPSGSRANRPGEANPAAETLWDSSVADAGIEEMLQVIKNEAPRRTTLEGMLFDQLRAQLPRQGEGYIFEKVIMPGNIELPNTGWRVNYSFRMPSQGIGSTPFSAGVTDEQGKVIRRFSGSIFLDREARGVQVIHRIRQGEPIGSADMTLVEGRLSQIPRGTFDEISRVDGNLARNELRPGQWLTDHLVEIPDVVKRGQAVTMRLEHGMIKISAPGIVRQDAGLGELVRVQNAHSGKELFAKVISKDEVQVIF